MKDDRSSWYRQDLNGYRIRLYVQPGSKKNQVVGVIHDELKIKLASPAIEGQANKALIRLLSTLLDLPPSLFTLKHGHQSRHKVMMIESHKINLDKIIP